MTRCPEELKQRLAELLRSDRKLTPEYADISAEYNVGLRQVQRWASDVRGDLALRDMPASGDADLDALLLQARLDKIETELACAVSRGDSAAAGRLLAEKRSLEMRWAWIG